ncbi:hypothetical protein [Nocardia alni]|uniref:hypothetical protein n=1 Tax=Nocardia alni TaxID=2815723 RepID=UPI001C2262FD|nr:hypothetical protein [Nocardia alni]
MVVLGTTFGLGADTGGAYHQHRHSDELDNIGPVQVDTQVVRVEKWTESEYGKSIACPHGAEQLRPYYRETVVESPEQPIQPPMPNGLRPSTCRI